MYLHHRGLFVTLTLCPGSANRGIGLELVRQLLQSPSTTIIAGCRKPPQATELSKLATASPDRVHVVEIDTANTASVNAAAASTADILGDGGIDYLLNNAGMVRLPRHSSRCGKQLIQ